MDNIFLAAHEDADRIAQAEADTTAHAWSSIMYASSLGSSHDTVWLYQSGQQVQGAAVVMQVLDEAHLQNFFIHRVSQRQGLASVLLQHAMQQAQRQGAAQMYLEVRCSNLAAQQLYRKHGFEEYARRKGYYRHADGQREDAILMKVML